MSNETLITADGLEKLKEELNELKSVRRIAVSQRIKEAIALGDLSENSEYDDAKNEQAFIEGRIVELENKIRTAKIIEESTDDVAKVRLGSKVILEDVETKERFEYTVVGTAEADPFNNRISNESPVGVAILGQNVDKAMRVLRAKLQDKAEQEAAASVAADRKSQVGTGDRSERIRTYNYPQGRVTDHRINLTLYKLDAVLNGDLEELIQALITADQAAKMQEADANE